MATVVEAWAAGATPIPVEIEDPQCLGVNKLQAHAILMPYPTLKEAAVADRQASAWARSLNGVWKFHWVPRPEQRPAGFHDPGFDVSRWADLPVPACWQVHGYGTPYYRNVGYTFRNDPPHVMSEPPREFTAYEERNPVGSYRRDFEVPAGWAGRRVFLTFDGVDSAFYLWINGKYAGYSVNSKNPAEFDVTALVKPGARNTVAVEVWRYCAVSYLEDQDKWRLSGITRNVTLWTAPNVHVRDFFVKTEMDAACRDAVLEVTAQVKNHGDSPSPARKLSVVLLDPKGRPAPSAAAEAAVPELEPGGKHTVTVRIPVAAPAKWTAEAPVLYTTVLALGDGRKADEYLSCRTGFRKVEIKGRVFTVNGVPVKLKGANRHEHWADTGHVISEARMIRDIEVLKQGNCNHVRTSHYSDDPRWYELCDEYGLWLVAEANVECHGQYDRLDRDPRYTSAIVDRNVANTVNFRNHASIVMWSLGNENGGGSSFVKALEAVRDLDPTRPVHYQSWGTGKDNPADVDSEMYTHPNDVARIAQDPALTKPFYMCEYAHAMNNSMGAIGEYNDLFDSHESLMGGAIWEWQDQGLWNLRNPGRPYLAYGGGFGEYPNDGYFIHKGVVWHDRTPKPHYPEMKRAYQWIAVEAVDLAAGTVRVRNRYQFRDLSAFRAAWEVAADGKPVARGTLKVPALAPGKDAVVTVPMGRIKPKPGQECFLRVSFSLARDESWAKKGWEAAAAQFKLPVSVPAPVLNPAGMKPLQLSVDPNWIILTGSGFDIVVDRAAGTIVRLAAGGSNLLVENGGPRPHFWRAPHRNDDDWADEGWRRYGLKALSWKTLSSRAVRLSPASVRVEISAWGSGKRDWGVNHTAVYTVWGDGTIVADHALSPRGKKIALARLGIRMSLDKKLARFAYLGRGPMENYIDRKRGFDIGLFEGPVAEQLTPYAKPMECGNHEDVRWLTLTDANGAGILVSAPETPVQASALPYADEVLEPPPYSVDLPPSRATVLVVSARTLGVGSGACGPRPLEQHMVRSEPVRFSYFISLLSRRVKDPSAVARRMPPRRPLPPLAGAGKEGTSIPWKSEEPGSPPLEGVFAWPAGLGEWKVTADSFQPDHGEPEFAVDGDIHSFWHTAWGPNETPHPHHLVVDFGKPIEISGIRYTARRWDHNGRIGDYEVFVGDDGKTWGEPAAKGRFENRDGPQDVRFAAKVTVRYLKLVALNEVNGKPYASVAELDVITR